MDWIKSHWPELILFIGLFIVAIGTICVNLKQSIFQRQLVDKNEKIAKLNEKIADLVTGGNSFCYIDPLHYIAATNTYLFSLEIEGSDPLYDVTIAFFDQNLFNKIKETEEEKKDPFSILRKIEKAEFKKYYPYLLRQEIIEETRSRWVQTGELFNINLSDDTHKFKISISARNGFFKQTILLKRVDNEYFFATRLIKEIDSSVLLEKIHPKFPRNASVGIEW